LVDAASLLDCHLTSDIPGQQAQINLAGQSEAWLLQPASRPL